MFFLNRLLKSASTDQIAAVDLGSNSFHMIIAQWQDHNLSVVDRLKEPVRLGFGLRPDGSLSDDAQQRAMACLQRFGQRLQGFSQGKVRIVGTKTLRSLSNAKEFLAQAEALLGHPVEIISGEEEARLIYLGVSHAVAPNDGNRLVMDIGGGSTEVILGQGMEPKLKESLDMGCVAVIRNFFPDGKVRKKDLNKALTYCRQQIEPVLEDFQQLDWQECIGASGSIKAVAEVCQAQGWSDGQINLEHLQSLTEQFLKHGDINLSLKGLTEDRQPVFFGGLVVLTALFIDFQLQQMIPSDWALREGLLYDLKGRLEHQDIRDHSVQRLAERFHSLTRRAQRVESTAMHLLKQVEEEWQLDDESASQLLKWASQLVLVGLDITHSDYHKHSAYIVQNVDLAGFSRMEQSDLAALILAHRKRFPIKKFPIDNQAMVRLAFLLRLAVILNRGREQSDLTQLIFRAKKNGLTILMEPEWIEQHPLTHSDLMLEQEYLQELPFKFKMFERQP